MVEISLLFGYFMCRDRDCLTGETTSLTGQTASLTGQTASVRPIDRLESIDRGPLRGDPLGLDRSTRIDRSGIPYGGSLRGRSIDRSIDRSTRIDRSGIP